MPLPIALAGVLQTLAANGLGMLANAVMSKGKELVEAKLGVKIPDEASQIDQAKLTELAQAQMKHQEFLISAALEETKAHLQDRADARARDVAVVKATGRNQRADVLAYGAMVMLAVTILLLFFIEVPRSTRDILLVVLGSLIVIVKDVYGFEFGTSKDSQRNAQAVVDQLKSNGT